MKKSNQVLTNFINEKYIPLAPRAKIGIGVALLLLPIVAFYFVYYQPKAKNIATLTGQTEQLKKQVQEAKAKAANKEKFEQELADAQLKFEETSVLLPKDSEIPKASKGYFSSGPQRRT